MLVCMPRSDAVPVQLRNWEWAALAYAGSSNVTELNRTSEERFVESVPLADNQRAFSTTCETFLGESGAGESVLWNLDDGKVIRRERRNRRDRSEQPAIRDRPA